MAQHFFGISQEELHTGAQPTIGTSTTSKDVEIAITDSVTGLTLNEIVACIEKIKERIISERGTNHVYR